MAHLLALSVVYADRESPLLSARRRWRLFLCRILALRRPGDTVKTTENNIPIPSPQTTAMVGNNFNEITLGFTLTQRG